MRYALYARVSTKGQGESGLGLDAQMAIAYNFYPQIEKEFIEIGSGKDIVSRPVLKDAIAYCKSNDAILVVAKVDRLSRNVVDGLTILEQMNGNIRFCDMPGEVDKFMLTLFFAFAERERLLISIRTKIALAERKKSGKRLGGVRRFTRQDAVKGGRVLADRSRANESNIRAKKMAEVLREGNNAITLQKIADHLNGSGFKTSKGNRWTPTAVKRLMK